MCDVHRPAIVRRMTTASSLSSASQAIAMFSVCLLEIGLRLRTRSRLRVKGDTAIEVRSTLVNRRCAVPAHRQKDAWKTYTKCSHPVGVQRSTCRYQSMERTMPSITTKDGVEIFYKDWG